MESVGWAFNFLVEFVAGVGDFFCFYFLASMINLERKMVVIIVYAIVNV